MRTQRAMRNQGGEHIAEIIEYRFDKDKRHGRGSRRAQRLSEIFLELERAANDARAPAIIVAEDAQYFLGKRTVLQRAIRRDDIDVIAVSAEHPKLRVDHQDAVDVGRLRGTAEQLADCDIVGRGDRLHDIGPLRDAFEPGAEG